MLAETNYGIQLEAWFTAPTTDSYTFYVASDDRSALYLGTNESEASKEKIAYLNNATPAGVITWYTSQKSRTINLVAGQKYYLNFLYHQQGGGANFGVYWETPTSPVQVLSARLLSPYLPLLTDCNGDVNGTATLDDCGVCVAGKHGLITVCENNL